MLRAILFDFNGVLVDDEPIHFELLRRVLAEEGHALDGRFLFRPSSSACPTADAFALFLRGRGETRAADRLSRLVARKAAYYQQKMWRDGFPIVPGAPELIEAAAAAGFGLGVVSGALRDEIDAALEQLGARPPLQDHRRRRRRRPTASPTPKGTAAACASSTRCRRCLRACCTRTRCWRSKTRRPASPRAAAAGLATLGLAHGYSAGRLSAADRVVPTAGRPRSRAPARPLLGDALFRRALEALRFAPPLPHSLSREIRCTSARPAISKSSPAACSPAKAKS